MRFTPLSLRPPFVFPYQHSSSVFPSVVFEYILELAPRNSRPVSIEPPPPPLDVFRRAAHAFAILTHLAVRYNTVHAIRGRICSPRDREKDKRRRTPHELRGGNVGISNDSRKVPWSISRRLFVFDPILSVVVDVVSRSSWSP